MLYGSGSMVYISRDLASAGQIRTQELIYPALLSSFSLEVDTQFIEAKALVAGKRQIVASAITEETAKFVTETEFSDWYALQHGYDEIAQTSASVVLPTLKAGVVPGGAGPYTFTDAEINSAGLAASVKAYVSSTSVTGERIFLTKVASAPQPGEYSVSAAGLFTFNAAQAGNQFQYVFNKTYTNKETIGYEPIADAFGSLSFSGLCYSTEMPGKMHIYIPKLTRTKTPSLSITGDISKLQTEYRASLEGNARRPFVLTKL